MKKQPSYEQTGTIEVNEPIRKRIKFIDVLGKENEDLIETGGVYIRRNKPGHLNRKDRRKKERDERLQTKAEKRHEAMRLKRKAERDAARKAKEAKKKEAA